MRVLIAGAGATGGAFGSRLQEAGKDVTYLVRPGRQQLLQRDGLRFLAPDGERTNAVTAISSVPEGDHYDLVVIAVKAPALKSILDNAGPAIGNKTLILPFLNGFDHIDLLEDAYPGQVIGGLVKIVAMVDDAGAIRQMAPLSTMTIGSLTPDPLPDSLVETLDVPGIDLTVTNTIKQQLWEKWAFISAAGAITCLLRNNVAAILEAGGRSQILQAIAETESVAAAAGYPVSESGHQQSLDILTAPGSAFTSSVYRDLQSGQAVEAEHLLGSLSARARTLNVDTPFLDLAVTQVRAHHINHTGGGIFDSASA
ncbi:ketopantoate reductase family protein [Arthrobacter castelli]|uniref:ketopantoate reductase family protein n=1 Tax=Arthrobacter castelli TaxID=271431 RepID=UPI0004124F49|nr:2-dehydropantoate 2-reductase [Arthrobacter castelli]